MAKKQNTSAARERKQKIVIGVGFAVLAVLMVLQGPKLLKAFGGGSDSTAAPSAAAHAAGRDVRRHTRRDGHDRRHGDAHVRRPRTAERPDAARRRRDRARSSP